MSHRTAVCRLRRVNDIEPVRITSQPSRAIVLLAVAAVAFIAGALVVGAFGPHPSQVIAEASPTPSPSAAPTIAATRVPLAIHCGPLAADLATCFAVIAATAGGAEDPSNPTTEIFVAPGSTRAWCAPPAPCVSAPPDSYWVTFDAGGGGLSVPVALGPDGWIAGISGQ